MDIGDIISFAIPRIGSDQPLTAVVSCKKHPDIKDEGDFKHALITAVTNWINKYPQGRQAWFDSCEDFNIGDLALNDSDPDLVKEMAACNIFEFCIFIYDAAPNWTYDTVLVNLKKLEIGEDEQ